MAFLRTQKYVLAVGTVLSTVLFTAACASDEAKQTGSVAATSSGQTTAEQVAAVKYPVNLQNCGRDLVVTKAPERVVALNQGILETLLSMDFGNRVVGAATFTDPILPELAAANSNIPRLAENGASLETVLAQEPDFVAASFSNTLSNGTSGSFESYQKVGVPAYLAYTECLKSQLAFNGVDGGREQKLTIDDIYQDIRDLAEIMGDKNKGEALISSLQQRITAVQAAGKNQGKTVAFWFANQESPYIAGGVGAPQIIADQLGLVNVFAENKDEWPQFSWEAVAAADPDYLVIGDLTRKSETAETAKEKINFLKNNPVTKNMRAVQQDHFIAVPGADMNPSLRTVEGMEKISAGINS